MNILIVVTGSVAGIKVSELTQKLWAIPYSEVKVVATQNGKKFLDQDMSVIDDHNEWSSKQDKILHIELRNWADVLVFAPLSANTMAKLALGLCDNLATSIYRAWNFNKPVILCPAMNTQMWNNYPTNKYIKILSKKTKILYPIRKRLACGDVGIGAMCKVDDIVKAVNDAYTWYPPIADYSIPINLHPGAYGVKRKHDYHSGVDLYCADLTAVFACEDGTIVKIDQFTGPELGYPFWETTYAMMVEGSSGVINYGEINRPWMNVGDTVYRGEQIGYVKRVLPLDKFRPDIPGHSTSMLHLELYKRGSREFGHWNFEHKSESFLDPTPALIKASPSSKLLTISTNLY